MVGNYRYERLANWEQFELLVRDLLQEFLGVSLAKFGKRGQEQHGIDLYGAILESHVENTELQRLGIDLSAIGKYLGIQCKSRIDGQLSFEQVKEDYEKTLVLREQGVELAAFIIATDTFRNKDLQLELSGRNQEIPLFRKILFWDDFEEMIARYNPIRNRHFPHLYSAPNLGVIVAKTLREELEPLREMFRTPPETILESTKSVTLKDSGLTSIEREIAIRLEHVEGITSHSMRDQSVRGLMQYASEMISQDNIMECLQSVLTLLLVHPEFASFWYGLAVVQFKNDNYSEAYWAIDNALKIDPERSDLWMAKCIIHLADDEPLKAFKVAKEALSNFGDHAQFYRLRGSALLKMRNLGPALRDFQKAYGYAHENSSIVVGNLAASLLEPNLRKKAVEILRSKLKENPKDDIVRGFLATALVLSNNYEDAVAEFERMESGNTSLEGFEGVYGVALKEAGQVEKGIDYFRIEVERTAEDFLVGDEKKATMWSELGEYHLMLKHFDDATMCFDKADSLHKGGFVTLVRRGIMHVQLEVYDVAEDFLMQANELNPDRPDVLWWLGIAQAGKEDLELAVRTLESGRTHDVMSRWDFETHLASILLRLSFRKLDEVRSLIMSGRDCSLDLEAARELALKSISYRKSVEAYEALMHVYRYAGDLEKAVEVCHTFLAAEPSAIDTLRFASYLTRFGKHQEALAACRSARVKGADFPEVICEAIEAMILGGEIDLIELLNEAIQSSDALFPVYQCVIAATIRQDSSVNIPRFRAALEHMKSLQNRFPDRPVVEQLLSDILNLLQSNDTFRI